MKHRIFQTAFALLIAAAIPSNAGPETELGVVTIETVAKRAERANAEGIFFPRDTGLLLPRQDEIHVLSVVFDQVDERKVSLFYPPGTSSDADGPPLPVMLCPMGMREYIMGVSMRFQEDQNRWAEHFAVSGAVSVLYDAKEIEEDLSAVLDFLVKFDTILRLDMNRLGFFAYSGNGRFTSHAMVWDSFSDRLKVVVFVNADPRPLSFPSTDVAFFLSYPNDGTAWERVGKAIRIRAERGGHVVEAVDKGPPKGSFGSPEFVEISYQVLTRLFTFLKTHL